VAINFVKNDDIRILRDIEQYYSTQIDEMPMNGESSKHNIGLALAVAINVDWRILCLGQSVMLYLRQVMSKFKYLIFFI